jgi:uncharacterized protein
MITINSRRFDGTLRKSWPVEFLERSGSLLTARGVFDFDVEHPHLNVIRRGTISYEFFWLDRWYNVFRFHEPDGSFRNFYCNVCMPPTLVESVLNYNDLDIDIVVDAAGGFTVLDEDEFRENAERLGYPDEILAKTDEAVAELIGLIERREFPFDYRESLQQNAVPLVIESSDLDHK